MYYSQNQTGALKGLLVQYIPVNTAVIADHFSFSCFPLPLILSHYIKCSAQCECEHIEQSMDR